jgi:hypothetical protein
MGLHHPNLLGSSILKDRTLQVLKCRFNSFADDCYIDLKDGKLAGSFSFTYNPPTRKISPLHTIRMLWGVRGTCMDRSIRHTPVSGAGNQIRSINSNEMAYGTLTLEAWTPH